MAWFHVNGYPPRRLARYPGMKHEEQALWDHFLTWYAAHFTYFNYDVRVGHGIDPPPGTDRTFTQMWYQLTKKRIDVVAHRADGLYILELKPRLHISAPGQVLSYRDLFVDTYRPKAPVRTGLVYHHAAPDDERLAIRSGVLLFQVPEYPHPATYPHSHLAKHRRLPF